jgi:FtsZ-interacting cell division protein ZipA
MSDLQIALIILGALIIAAVVIYNWMQERKLRKEVTSEFIVPQKDVLADDFHIDADAYIIDKEMAEVAQKAKPFQNTIPTEQLEQTLDVSQKQMPEARETEPVVLAKEVETSITPPQKVIPKPVISESIVKAVLDEESPPQASGLPQVTHPQIDLTALMYLNKSVGANDLNGLATSLANTSLSAMLHGLDSQDKWYLLSESPAATVFKQVACSLQLADRGGPVAKNVLNKFQFAVEDAGLELNAHVEWQGSGDAMQRSIELDQFCIEVDQIISVHVAQTDTPIHGTKFKGLAEASGMSLKEDGKFHFEANDKLLFTAIDTNNVPFTAESLRSNVLKSITFQIEIPKVSSCEQVFNQMISVVQKMASSLNASLVDDNQKPLGDLQIEKIRQQLKVIHATMVARGIMPGSPSSMRLFN